MLAIKDTYILLRTYFILNTYIDNGEDARNTSSMQSSQPALKIHDTLTLPSSSLNQWNRVKCVCTSLQGV